MPRLARLRPISFGWYYVAMKGVIGRRIVTHQDDLIAVHKVLRRTLRERHVRLHAGYISEQEVHLVLHVGEAPLSAITGRFQHEYARVFNASHAEHGSLFRLHYRSLLFQHRHWLVPLIHIVHWLPRMERRDKGSDGLWWSTDTVYRGEVAQDWVTTSAMLRMLTQGAYRRSAQEKAYRELMGKPPNPDRLKLFRSGSVEDPRILGDKEFIADTWRMSGRRATVSRRKSNGPEEDIREVLLQIIRQFNALCDSRLQPKHAAAWTRVLTYENVRSRSRRSPLPMVRALSASYVAERKIATLMEAARFFGHGARSLSAGRRRQHANLFRKWFGVEPDVLFGALVGDPGVGGGATEENLYIDARIPRRRAMFLASSVR
jgi:hypothetical protein